MAEIKHQDLFCSQCFLQFDKKYVFDLHLSLVHGKKLVIKNEASEISFDESREEEESVKNKEKWLKSGRQKKGDHWIFKENSNGTVRLQMQAVRHCQHQKNESFQGDFLLNSSPVKIKHVQVLCACKHDHYSRLR